MQILDAPSRCLFFTGKGGVGKTTLACATALHLADSGKRVLLVSTDPASNLSEMLGIALSSAPTSIPGADTLCALDIDPEEAAEAYRVRALEPLVGKVDEAEMAKRREELSGACTTEIAAFDRFAGLLSGEEDSNSYDHVVFDTAPTGHTLRLLDLPRAWTDFLDSNTRGASCLGPHSALTMRQERFARARRALEDASQTTVVLVTRPERGALREAARTSVELAELGVANQRLVVNGVFHASVPDDPLAQAFETRCRLALSEMPIELVRLPRTEVPLRAHDMVGLPALRAVLDDEISIPSPPSAAAVPAPMPHLSSIVEDLANRRTGLVMVMGKGGVGKTTVACAVAVELASRGIDVLLSTTDPAAHVAATVEGSLEHLEVSRIDPEAETRAYIARVMARKGKDLDDDGKALLLEDLRSPCTEEVAVFHAFSHLVAEANRRMVVLDTAPTGHTLMLLDATGSYHRDVLRGFEGGGGLKMITPLMRLRDPAYTHVLLVTLPETTPVTEAAALQEDLRRAGVEPYAWIVNSTMAGLSTRDPILSARAHNETAQVHRVSSGLATRTAIVPLANEPPRGVLALRDLVRRLPQ